VCGREEVRESSTVRAEGAKVSTFFDDEVFAEATVVLFLVFLTFVC